MMKRLLAICCGLALAGSVACGEVDDDHSEDDPTALQLASSVDKKADVKYMKYNVYKIELGENEKCTNKYIDPNDHISETDPKYTDYVKKKKGMTMPGSWGRFHKKPLDPESQHKFFDLFLGNVKAGCYVAHVTPLQKDKETPSAKCLPTHGVFGVKPKKLTEGVMISQCPGLKAMKGTLDMIVALNKPPKIKDVTLDPQKFRECPADENKQPSVTSCVKVVEPDKDPVKLEWALKEKDDKGKFVKDEYGKTILKDPFFTIDPKGKGEFDDKDAGQITGVNYKKKTDYDNYLKEIDKNGKIKTVRVVEACIEIKFERKNEHAAYDFAITAFDMLWDIKKIKKKKKFKKKKTLVTFEDWFAKRNITDRRHLDEDDHDSDGKPIKSRDMRQLVTYVDDCEDPPVDEEGKLACNQSQGFWRNPRFAEFWEDTPFDRDTEKTCQRLENNTLKTYPNSELWLDLLFPITNQYYSLARQYVTAKLNYNAVSWTQVDGDDPAEIQELAELLKLVLSFTEKIVNDFDGKENQEPLCKELPTNQAAAINNLIDERLGDIYEDDTTFEDAFASFSYEDVDRETLMDILEDFNDEDDDGERYCLSEPVND